MATSSKQPRLHEKQTVLKESVETCAKIPCRCLFFVMCNAATSQPYSFSEAVCDTIPYGHKYAFGSFFENGVILLNNYLDDPAAFQAASEQEHLAVKRLLDFIADEGNCSISLHLLSASEEGGGVQGVSIFSPSLPLFLHLA